MVKISKWHILICIIIEAARPEALLVNNQNLHIRAGVTLHKSPIVMYVTYWRSRQRKQNRFLKIDKKTKNTRYVSIIGNKTTWCYMCELHICVRFMGAFAQCVFLHIFAYFLCLFCVQIFQTQSFVCAILLTFWNSVEEYLVNGYFFVRYMVM